MVRIAQGLLYMGKGMLTLSSVFSDKTLLNQNALAGLLVVLTKMMNGSAMMFTHEMHWLL